MRCVHVQIVFGDKNVINVYLLSDLIFSKSKKHSFILYSHGLAYLRAVKKDLTPRVFLLFSRCTKFMPHRGFHSGPPDLDLGALTKWLASRC
jgi:hypothetical protein